MLLTGIVFSFSVIVIFSIVMLLTRPTTQEAAVNRRLTEVLGSHLNLAKIDPSANADLLARGQARASGLTAAIQKTAIGIFLQRLIVQSQVRVSVTGILQWIAGLAIGAGLLTWFLTHMAFLVAIAVLLMGLLPIGYLRFRRERRLAAFNLALPECIETCSRALRAGHSLVAALSIVSDQAREPAKTEFDEVFKKQNYGLPLRDALTQMLDRVPSTDLQVMITAFLVQRDTGGNLVDILDRLVFVIRDRLRIHRDIRTHTAQGRMTGWILCLLPVFLLLAINILNPGYSKPLFHDPTGKKMLYAGIVLLLGGGWLIRHIIHGIEV